MHTCRAIASERRGNTFNDFNDLHLKAKAVTVLCVPYSAAETHRSGSEAGSHLRLIDFVYRSTLGLRVIKKKKTHLDRSGCAPRCLASGRDCLMWP